MRRSAALVAVVLAVGVLPLAPARAGAAKSAQSRLRNGLAAALTFYTDADTFTGFDAAQGGNIEPSLDWVDATEPAGQQVDVQFVGDQKVLLVSRTPDGRFFSVCQRARRYGYGWGNSFARVDEMEDCRLSRWP